MLELIVATALRDEPGAALQALLPVLVGPAAEGGGFAPFPFCKLARLSDEPSMYTLHPTPTPYAPHPTNYTLHLEP